MAQQLKKRIVDALQARGGVIKTAGSRNLVARLAIDFGSPDIEADVRTTLLDLERDGVVRIFYASGQGSLIRKIVHVGQPQPRRRPGSVRSVRKTVRMPTVTQTTSLHEGGADMAAPKTTRPRAEFTRDERLTFALNALQERAGDGGVLDDSAAKIIAQALEITDAAANMIAYDLLRLGLRSSERVAGNRFEHRVGMGITRVTPEMVHVLTQADRERKQPGQPASASLTETRAFGVVVGDDTDDIDVVSGLLDVVRRLEGRVDELTAALQAADSSLRDGLAVVERLNADNESQKVTLDANAVQIEALVAERDALSREVAKLRRHATVRPDALAVLRSYGVDPRDTSKS